MLPSKGKKWPQIVAALSANVVVFATGCHGGWPAPSIPKLLTEFPFIISNEEASYITIIAHLGNICGGLTGPNLLDRIGRKKTLLSIALPLLVSFFLIIMSYQVMELLYVARFIGGIAEGMTYTTVPFYIAETSEPSIRGALGTLVAIVSILGLLYANLVGSYLSIKATAITLLVFPLLFLVLFWKMPESPYYLVMKNQKEEAKNALIFLRRRSVSDELSVLIKDVDRQMSESGSFKDIFLIDSNRKAFILMVFARTFQPFTGISAFGQYIQLLLGEATDSVPPHIGATLIFLVQLAMVILSTFFVDKWGRKPLLIFSIGGCAVNLLLQAVFFTLKQFAVVDVSLIDWFPLAMMMVFIVVYSTGLSSLVSILSGEIFSASIKGKSVCLVNIFFALSVLSTTKFYQVTTDNFGLFVPYWTFGLCSVMGAIYFYVFLPETKGKTLEEIQQFLKGNSSIHDKSKRINSNSVA